MGMHYGKTLLCSQFPQCGNPFFNGFVPVPVGIGVYQDADILMGDCFFRGLGMIAKSRSAEENDKQEGAEIEYSSGGSAGF